MNESNFLDELLAEAEVKEEKRTSAFFDLIVMEVSRLESEITHNFTEMEKEIEIIKEWALKRNSVIQERADFLKLKLESYIRQEGKKTIDLPHGTLKIRKMPDKVEITDLNLFLTKANSEMLMVIPEQVKPDLNKIKSFIKMTTKIPEGVTLIEGREEFRLTLKTNLKEETEE
ncbi:MAG TPA: host-nuclease inhibitor Gam family protein [Ignavibacteriaceae bacterium]|nr:host-nuclease inhibitor Gam family protein [Ignavibacteriaceae bacterium]